ncbi:hypothetical protein ONS96_010581 [Cadophora gregata f. sp. sojae]|nr:hypothetical protein ONS96_010581 [Cadophora gregata f. sp. sojae]
MTLAKLSTEAPLISKWKTSGIEKVALLTFLQGLRTLVDTEYTSSCQAAQEKRAATLASQASTQTPSISTINSSVVSTTTPEDKDSYAASAVARLDYMKSLSLHDPPVSSSGSNNIAERAAVLVPSPSVSVSTILDTNPQTPVPVLLQSTPERHTHAVRTQSPIQLRPTQLPDSRLQVQTPQMLVRSPQTIVPDPRMQIQNSPIPAGSPQTIVPDPRMQVQNSLIPAGSPQMQVQSPRMLVPDPRMLARNLQLQVQNPQMLAQSPVLASNGHRTSYDQSHIRLSRPLTPYQHMHNHVHLPSAHAQQTPVNSSRHQNIPSSPSLAGYPYVEPTPCPSNNSQARLYPESQFGFIIPDNPHLPAPGHIHPAPAVTDTLPPLEQLRRRQYQAHFNPYKRSLAQENGSMGNTAVVKRRLLEGGGVQGNVAQVLPREPMREVAANIGRRDGRYNTVRDSFN